MQTSKLISELENSQSTLKLDQDDSGAQRSADELYLDEIQERQDWKPSMDWLSRFQPYSRLLMAAIAPDTWTLRYANDHLVNLMGISPAPTGDLGSMGIRLFDVFPDLEDATREQLFRRHLLYLVFRDIYQVDIQCWRILEEPIMASLKSPLYAEPRFIQFWLRSEQLRVSRIDPGIDEFRELELETPVADRWARWMNPMLLDKLEQQLKVENYRIEGLMLLEGIDVTIQETIRRLEQRLIDRDSILRPEKFEQLSQQMRSLFRAKNSLILRAEGEQAQILLGNDYERLSQFVHPMQSLQGSHFLRAAKANRVCNISDLALDCQSECEQDLVKRGVRSLLLIPVVVRTRSAGKSSRQLMGLVGLSSDRPNNFDELDCKHAESLIPALTAALRQANHGRFTHIHPAVEWRFLEEGERRSWGLPPEQIIFNDVYPIYGISDIRGSSEERNRAIQEDLLEQFRLGLAVVEAVCQHQKNALSEQLRMDLIGYTDRLRENLTVEAEVTAIQYLKKRLEIYFDYFAECGTEASAAVDAYRNACANANECVYVARDRFDQLINQIRSALRTTWEGCQVSMQQIVPHYCDVECTDGIDHMIYAGASIDPKFSAFHLHSLRYEQLRAVCECARTYFSLSELANTHLQLTHLILVQDTPVDIFHDEKTEKLFDVRGTSDTRYEIVKKRLDKGIDEKTQTRITQPGMLTLVYSTDEEWAEYQQYLRYLARDGWIDTNIESGTVAPLQGVTGLKFARVRILPATTGSGDGEGR
ncbi:MAG TPA: GAF domain-containing protein [Candidatus Obscuribacterales bacterium]